MRPRSPPPCPGQKPHVLARERASRPGNGTGQRPEGSCHGGQPSRRRRTGARNCTPTEAQTMTASAAIAMKRSTGAISAGPPGMSKGAGQQPRRSRRGEPSHPEPCVGLDRAVHSPIPDALPPDGAICRCCICSAPSVPHDREVVGVEGGRGPQARYIGVEVKGRGPRRDDGVGRPSPAARRWSGSPGSWPSRRGSTRRTRGTAA